jgi:di/tricarboxylate transporter/CRP-like cAMP-binding protein
LSDGRDAARGELLSTVDLFAGLDRIALARLAANLDPVTFESGEAACVRGEPGDSLYIVSQGTLGVYIAGGDGHAEVRVATLRAPACFGEMALLTGEPRSATVRAVGPAEALRLDRTRFVELLRREPTIGLSISATLSRRLVQADQRYLRLEKTAVAALDARLGELEPNPRQRVLRASLLDAPTRPAMAALFGDEVESTAAAFRALVGGDAPSAELLELLRERWRRGLGRQAAAEDAARAVEGLAAAGRWEEALHVASREGTRDQLLAVLERAVRDEEWAGGQTAGEWLEGVGDEEAGRSPTLATAMRTREARRADEDGRAAGGGTGGMGARGAPAGGLEGTRVPGDERAQPARRSWPRPGGHAAVAFVGALALGVAAAVVGPGQPQVAFLLLLAAAICLWVTAVLPEFAVGVALASGWILTGVATPAEALAGYGTSTWMTAFTILGLGGAIATSGLLFRVGLLLVRRMPTGLVGQAATFLLTGLILTPLLPSSTARAGLALPLALTAAQTQRLEEQRGESALLGLAAYVGSNPLLFAFLNGSTSCLLAFGLMPEASRARFDWTTWFLAALPLTAVAALGTLALMVLLLRPGRVAAGSRSRLNLQLSLLGRPSAREIAMSVILLATVLGWNLAPVVGLSSTVVGLLALLAAIVTGCFTRQSLQGLNWDFLVSYGVVIGLAQLAVKVGLDRVAADAVGGALGGVSVSPYLFVPAIGVLCLVVRVFLPQDQALLLMALALFPAAPVIGVDPWVIAIAILATFSPWFFPSQTIGYPVAYEAAEGRLFTHGQARLVCAAYMASALVGLAVSVPYWRTLGLL